VAGFSAPFASLSKIREANGVHGNAATESKLMRLEGARHVGPNCQKESGVGRSTVMMLAGRLPQGPGTANYRGQTGRFMRIFARILGQVGMRPLRTHLGAQTGPTQRK
jgi:hypothetical protein